MPNSLMPGVVRKLLVYILVSLFSTAVAMPPNPDMLDEHLNKGEPLPYYLQNRANLLTRGVNAAAKMSTASKSAVTGSYKVLAVLIKFSDKNNSVNAADFDTLLFVNQQSTVNHYFDAVSYGQLDIITVNLPSSVGWVTAPQTYAYYCNAQNGTGSYPQNSQKLCEDVVDVVDPMVDFSQYDNDSDGYVDAVILVHTGPGAEFTASDDDIWSHKWSVPSPRLKDGVYIFNYTIQPEYWSSPGDITCGVYCHELGHIFGLPDLYDTDYSSRGIGKWSLMAYGSWNGPTSMGDYPSELDAWSRIELGFNSSVNVTSNSSNVDIASVESGGNIYRLWSNGTVGDEYFLVENRQKIGYDAYLPGDGLLIWHIDETELSSYCPNDNEWYPGYTDSGNYGVALEQADGSYQMEQLINSGDAGDPFPGSFSVTSFSALSNPNSNSYAGSESFVAVGNISLSAPTMVADFQVSIISDVTDTEDRILPLRLELGQNFPNPFNPVTNMSVSLPEATHVTLSIYNILGRKINELLDEDYAAGMISVTWNGLDLDKKPVPSGVYFYEVVTDCQKEVKKMTLIK